LKNAHLRFGWLTCVKSTEKTTTSIKLRLDRFIGEVLPDPPWHAKAHLISVIGGDTQIAAVSGAISMGDRFMVEAQASNRSASVWSAIIPALGIGCESVIVSGQKEQLLSWLSWSVESGAIRLPTETGSIRWPGMNLEELVLQAD
jgi:hypothetical protein